MEPLFVKKSPKFEKLAQEAQMPINDAEWPAAILGELYKQAPYVEGAYQPEIRISEKDPETGYAVGRIVLYSATTVPQRQALSEEGKARGTRLVNIPFMIRQFRLAPLDLMMTATGEFRPQTRARLRDSLFKPQVADGVARAPATTIFDINTQPSGVGGAYGGDGLNAAVIPWDKTSAPRSLFSEIIVDDPEVCEGLARRLAADPVLLKESAALVLLVRRADALSKETAKSRLPSVEKFARRVPATVRQIRREAGAIYRVKRANVDAYEPVEEEMDRAEALDEFGPDEVMDADEAGLVTISTNPVVREDLREEKIEPVTDFGLYRVKTRGDGRQIIGWVFPHVVGLDGTTLPMAVFNNGSENSIQRGFAGARASTSMELPDERPSGVGVFYRVTGDRAVALLPLVVAPASVDEETDTRTHEAKTLEGEDVVLHLTPGVNGIQPMSEEGEGGSEYMLPADMKFMPLPNERQVEIVEDADEWSKLGHLRSHKTQLTVRYMGDDLYTLGGCGVEKLAARDYTRIPPEDALFLLTVVGMDPTFAVQKLARARSMRVVTIPNLRTLTPASERLAVEEAKVASRMDFSWMRLVPPPVWIAKAAASILNDPESLDQMLSLGFINPRNVGIFLSYLPDLERTQGKVSEILFTARAGNDRELEAAAEQTMHGMEGVLSGLKNIQLEMQDDEG